MKGFDGLVYSFVIVPSEMQYGYKSTNKARIHDGVKSTWCDNLLYCVAKCPT